MPNFFQTKTAGLPRWAWFALIGGGIVIGLILRSRKQKQAADAASGDGPAGAGDVLGGSSTQDPGLAGVGVLAPPAGSVIPVQQPEIPQAYSDTFQSLIGSFENLGQGAMNLAGGVAVGSFGLAQTYAQSYAPNAQGPSTASATSTATATAPTGGGAPKRNPDWHIAAGVHPVGPPSSWGAGTAATYKGRKGYLGAGGGWHPL